MVCVKSSKRLNGVVLEYISAAIWAVPWVAGADRGQGLVAPGKPGGRESGGAATAGAWASRSAAAGVLAILRRRSGDRVAHPGKDPRSSATTLARDRWSGEAADRPGGPAGPAG